MSEYLWWLSLAGFAIWVLAPVLARAEIAPPMGSFAVWSLAGAFLAMCLALGLYCGFRAGWMPVGWSLLLAGAPSLILGVLIFGSWGSPPINDVSTDHSNPPEIRLPSDESERWRVAPRPGEDAVRLQQSAYPEVRALNLPHSPEAVFARAVECAQDRRGWEIGAIQEESLRLSGTERTTWFRFPDDFTVEVRPTKDGKSSIVHMRSRSRHGVSDLGQNAMRIVRYLEELQGKF